MFTEKNEVRRHVGGKVERKEEGAEGAANGGIVGLESICAFLSVVRNYREFGQ